MARTAGPGIGAWRREAGYVGVGYEDDEDDDTWPDDGFDPLWDDDGEPPPPGGWPCHG
jgi:hypothetical protein